MEGNCRICLNYLKIENRFSVNKKIFENKSILDLIHDWASIEIAKADKLPPVICSTCYVTIKSFTDFILLIRKSDVHFKQSLCRDGDDIMSYNTSKKNEAKDKLTGTEKAKEFVSEHHLNESKNENYKLFEERCKVIKFTVNSNTDEKVKLPFTIAEKRSLIPYECLICHKTFKRLYQYNIHMAVHTGEKKYSCNICGKCFSRSYILVYHMRVHTGEKKFHCNICSKSFIHPSNLYKHRKIHTDTKNYKCEQCSKSFIQSEALKIHIRRIHTGEKPFLCEICSKSFSSQSALWIHKQDTHKEKESCIICKKQFSSRILKRHIERHKNKEENIKKYICEQCGKNFSSDHNLRQHLLGHNGMKPYASEPMPCPICKKLYSKRRIKSHICLAVKK